MTRRPFDWVAHGALGGLLAASLSALVWAGWDNASRHAERKAETVTVTIPCRMPTALEKLIVVIKPNGAGKHDLACNYEPVVDLTRPVKRKS